MKALTCAALLFVLLSFSLNDDIIGKWETKPSPKGNVTSVVFKSDNSFEGFINKKPFVTGQYSVTEGVLTFVDNGCNGAEGTYRLVFFSDSDSLRFEPITDSCNERRNGMSRTILGRVK